MTRVPSHLNKHQKKKLKRDIESLTANVVVNPSALDFVQVSFDDSRFELIGCGCSSAVFRSRDIPFVAAKIYSKAFRKELFNEVIAYRKTKGLDWFPHLYFYGRGYIAIEYVEGHSLYDCLFKGIDIDENILAQVDEAIDAAKERGLKPSDVHFKNVLVNDGQVMLVDLSDYLTAEHVNRWTRLKFFYKTVYRPFFRRVRIPKPLLDFFRKAFKVVEKLLDIMR